MITALGKCMPCVVQGLRVDKKIIKLWKIARIMNLMFLRKFKKPISCFHNEVFSFLSFSPCFLSAYYFSFALLTIIRATKWQSKHINKTSNINKVITISSWRNQDKMPY